MIGAIDEAKAPAKPAAQQSPKTPEAPADTGATIHGP